MLSREDLPQTDQCVKCWNASVVNGIIHDLIQSHTGVGSGGYALTPPTIYVEGILICIYPLEKPNT